MIVIRTTTATTAQCADAILAYAKHPALKHLRLAATKRYVDVSEFPPNYTSGALLQNSPLLLAVADLDLGLPYTGAIANATSISAVIDYPGMTRQRSHRASEVDTLLADLLALQLPQGKIAYAVQPVCVTEQLAAADARTTILAADFQDFQTLADATDLKRRLGG
jgi:hypothetical protein